MWRTLFGIGRKERGDVMAEKDALVGMWFEAPDAIPYGDDSISCGHVTAKVSDSLYLVAGPDSENLRQVLVSIDEMAEWGFYDSLEQSLNEKTWESRRKQEEEEDRERIRTVDH
jgi:hypothetical protein